MSRRHRSRAGVAPASARAAAAAAVAARDYRVDPVTRDTPYTLRHADAALRVCGRIESVALPRSARARVCCGGGLKRWRRMCTPYVSRLLLQQRLRLCSIVSASATPIRMRERARALLRCTSEPKWPPRLYQRHIDTCRKARSPASSFDCRTRLESGPVGKKVLKPPRRAEQGSAPSAKGDRVN